MGIDLKQGDQRINQYKVSACPVRLKNMAQNPFSESSLPDNFSIPNCGLEDDDKKNLSNKYLETFSTSIIIAVLSPVAVVGNALILAAIWKKTFQRTLFHILLSGLAVTDLCTGMIAQPFTAATSFLHLASGCKTYRNRSVINSTVDAIGDASSTYFISITVFIITLMAVERWLHMSRRSLITSRRGYFIVIVLLLIPIPVAVFRSLETIKGNSALELNITIIAVAMFCFLTTSVFYLNVVGMIRCHRQQVQSNTQSQNFGQPAINLAKYQKSVVTILYILGLFYFCFLPHIVSIGVYVYFSSDDPRGLSVALHVSTILLFLSSSLNPGLYLWRMNDVRNGVKQLFCKLISTGF